VNQSIVNTNHQSQFLHIREAVTRILNELEPAGSPRSDAEGKGLMLYASGTIAGRDLPAYYLVYFLLIDLLGYPSVGQWEKTAWAVPVRYRGRLYGIEHRKFGIGVFAPNLDPSATRSVKPNEQAEEDAREITHLITKAVSIAEPYFQWRAEQAVSTADINVINKSIELYDRYEFFRNRFWTLSNEAEQMKAAELNNKKLPLHERTYVYEEVIKSYQLHREINWTAQAAIEAFFSWTEHAFIHLAILQGKLSSGEEIANLAESDWKAKFKSALDVTETQTKVHYDRMLDLRAQVRNFVAHGAFGKRGEAFSFHSGAGAVPVILTNNQKHRFSFTGRTEYKERLAIADIESFLQHLWSGSLAPAKHYIFSSLPSIVSYVEDGTYKRLMQSEDEMKAFVTRLSAKFNGALDMDWF
jgi:hypothetical protein